MLYSPTWAWYQIMSDSRDFLVPFQYVYWFPCSMAIFYFIAEMISLYLAKRLSFKEGNEEK
jgi:hypothetical protein